MGLFKKKDKSIVNNNTNAMEPSKEVGNASNINNAPKVEVPLASQQTVASTKPKENKLPEAIVLENKETPKVEVPLASQQTVDSTNPKENKLPEAIVLENKEIKSEKIETKIRRKKDLSFLLYVFGIVIIFVICMPIIRNIFVPKVNYTYEANKELESDNLEFGYIVIGKEKSYMKKEKIKFYNFKMYENYNLIFNYIADSAVRNPSDLNIYIIVYNRRGIIVHKEKFNYQEKIKKQAEGSYSIQLSALTYKEALYVKILTMSEEQREKELICKSTETSDKTKINNEMSYKFIDGMLQSYSIIQKYDSTEAVEKLDNNYKNTYDKLKQTNILDQDISLNNNSIYYKIDYNYFDKGEISFNLRYAKNDYIDYVKAVELKREWTCE